MTTRLTDEQLAAIAATEGWHWDQPRAMARELLTARRVVEAARKLSTEADPVRYAGGCRTGASTVWDESLQELSKALAAHDAAKEKP